MKIKMFFSSFILFFLFSCTQSGMEAGIIGEWKAVNYVIKTTQLINKYYYVVYQDITKDYDYFYKFKEDRSCIIERIDKKTGAKTTYNYKVINVDANNKKLLIDEGTNGKVEYDYVIDPIDFILANEDKRIKLQKK